MFNKNIFNLRYADVIQNPDAIFAYWRITELQETRRQHFSHTGLINIDSFRNTNLDTKIL